LVSIDATVEESDIETQCPATFVVPEHPSNGKTVFVSDSGCAVPCVNPYWTRDSWNSLTDAALAMPIIGTPFPLHHLLSLSTTSSPSPSPFLSPSHLHGLSPAGLVLCLLMAGFLLSDHDSDNKFLLLTYTLLSAVVSLWSIVVNARPVEDRFCYDNAIQFTGVTAPCYAPSPSP
jgi:hypothetical protein